MTHPFDKDLLFLENATVTQSLSTGPITVWGGIEEGLAARVVVKDAYAAADTMQAKVYISTDGGTTYNLAAQSASVTPKGGHELIVPFPVKPGKSLVKLELTVTGTTKSYTGVYAGVVPNPGFDYTRKTNWE